MGERSKISSFIPRKNIIVAAAIKYCIQGAVENGTTIEMENINAIKIPTPPNEGMGYLCIFRSEGISKKFFASDIFITIGITEKVTKKEIIDIKITDSILNL